MAITFQVSLSLACLSRNLVVFRLTETNKDQTHSNYDPNVVCGRPNTDLSSFLVVHRCGPLLAMQLYHETA